MKIKMMVLVWIVAITAAAVEPIRVWTFKKGGKTEAQFVRFGVPGTMVVAQGERELIINIADLTTNQYPMIVDLRKKEADAKLVSAIEKSGRVKFSVSTLKNYREKIFGSNVWADVEFVKMDSRWVDILNFKSSQDYQIESLARRAGYNAPDLDWRDTFVGFEVKDGNGDIFDHCLAPKNQVIDQQISKLKNGERIRITGGISKLLSSSDWLIIESVKPIETTQAANEKNTRNP